MTRPIRHALLAFTLSILIGMPCRAQLRTWTSQAGTTLEARAVRATSDERVVLQMSSGKELSVPFWQLSAKDQNYIALKFGVKIENTFRTWTDRGGTQKIRARLVSLENGVIVLQKANGKEYSLPVTRLSKADQRFARQQISLEETRSRQRYLQPVPDVERLIDLGLRGWSDGPSNNSMARCAVVMKQMDVEECVRGLNYYRYTSVWEADDASKRQRVGNALLFLAQFGPVHFRGWDDAEVRLAKEVFENTQDDVERGIALMTLAGAYRIETMMHADSNGQEGTDLTNQARNLVSAHKELLKSGNLDAERAALLAVADLRELAEPNREFVLSTAAKHENFKTDDLEASLSQAFVESSSGTPRLTIPKRSADASPNLIDLTRFYNASLKGNWHKSDADSDLSELPTGIQTFAGTRFDVRGIVQVTNGRRYVGHLPHLVGGFPVTGRVQKIHVLHGAIWGDQQAPGAPIGRYILRYVDGSTQEREILLGEDVLDWYHEPSDDNAEDLTVAWQGSNPHSRREGKTIRLYKTTWKNPRPDQKVMGMFLESAGRVAAPFVIAITIE